MMPSLPFSLCYKKWSILQSILHSMPGLRQPLDDKNAYKYLTLSLFKGPPFFQLPDVSVVAAGNERGLRRPTVTFREESNQENTVSRHKPSKMMNTDHTYMKCIVESVDVPCLGHKVQFCV